MTASTNQNAGKVNRRGKWCSVMRSMSCHLPEAIILHTRRKQRIGGLSCLEDLTTVATVLMFTPLLWGLPPHRPELASPDPIFFLRLYRRTWCIFHTIVLILVCFSIRLHHPHVFFTRKLLHYLRWNIFAKIFSWDI